MQKATFGAGCFWGVEETYRKLKGVKLTKVGFMGGKTKNPSYKEVCKGDTGHTEVVQIEFYQEEINYDELLEKFWEIHDPTQKNRQGPDIGYQYRSVIFYHNEEQKEKAIKSKEKISNKFDKDIETRIEKAKEFYPAEEYHQKYFQKHGVVGCHI